MKFVTSLAALCLLLGGGVTCEAAETAPVHGVREESRHSQTAKPAFEVDASALEVLSVCRKMLPDCPIMLKGAIIMRSRKGITQSEYDYTLVADRTKTPATVDVVFTPRGETNVIDHVTVSRPGPVPEGRILKTDVTWLDLTLDFLWWPNAMFEAEREGETIHGQKCAVMLAKPDKPVAGVSAARLWVDRRTGCMMQAEQLDEAMKPVRRLWGTRVKKFGERWMANVIEVETLGSGHRTKITVESIDDTISSTTPKQGK